MHSPSFTFYLAIFFVFAAVYLFIEYVISQRIKQDSPIVLEGDKRSLKTVMEAILIGHLAAFGLAYLQVSRFHFPYLLEIGLGMIVIGLIVRMTSIKALGKRFTYSVSKIENHEIYSNGLYSVIRHPGYLGQILIFLGISMALHNWLSIIGMAVIVIPAYLYRIRVEEKFMLEHIDGYDAYRSRTSRLIPFVY